MDQRVLVAGKADVADLAGLLRRQHRFHRAARREDAVRVFHPDDLVKLHRSM